MNDELIKALLAVIVAVFGSTGFWSYLQAKSNKTAELLKSIKSCDESVNKIILKVNEIEDKNNEREARNCRNRIVRFADEIKMNEESGISTHSEEMYTIIMDDIRFYKAYVDINPNFKNAKAVKSIERIESHFAEDDYV